MRARRQSWQRGAAAALAAVAAVAALAAAATADDLYEPFCTEPKDVQLRKNPALHFFSAKNHSARTLGCANVAPVFEVGPSDVSGNRLGAEAEAALRAQLLDSGLYDPQVVTYFMAHAFGETWDAATYYCRIKDMILNNSAANVFLIDWSGGSVPADPLDYEFSVRALKPAAQLVSAFANSLLAVSGQRDAGRLHLLGHSLGGHLAGFIGYSVDGVGRITGLDPASPCFNTSRGDDLRQVQLTGRMADGSRRLSQASAKLVVSLHTDTPLFGLNENHAHYDVYINGGVKMPGCTLANLQNANWAPGDAINNAMACAHRYSHDVIDTFAAVVRGEAAPRPPRGAPSAYSNQLGQGPIAGQAEADRRCYQVARRCESSEAFELGECGLCLRDDSPDCVYVGLSFQTADSAPQYDGPTAQQTDQTITCYNRGPDADRRANGELLGRDQLPECSRLPTERNQLGHHFLKTDKARPMTCLYQYQVIVAAKRAGDQQGAVYFLQVPVNGAGRLRGVDGSAQQDRLVQVSHRVEPGTDAHERIRRDYVQAVASSRANVKLSANGVDFYTALVTFAVADCNGAGGYNASASAEEQAWTLCSPLDTIQEAQILASSKALAKGIKWAGFNYLGGLDARTRQQYSYVFKTSTFTRTTARQNMYGVKVKGAAM